MKSLSSRVASASMWSILGQISLYTVKFASFLVVPLYIKPADYGAFGYSLLFVSFFQLLIETVLPMAIVQSRRPIAELAYVGLIANSVFAALAYLLLFSLATRAEYLLGDRAVGILIPVLGTQLFLSALYSTHVAILRRKLEFRKLFLIRVSGAIPSTLATVLLAVAGYGYWALVIGWLAGGLSQTIATWLIVPLPRYAGVSPNVLREMLRFSKWVALDITANWALEFGVGFFVGIAFGAAVFGRFRLVDQIIRSVCAIILDPLSPVVYSTLSLLQRDGASPAHALPRLNHVFGTISIPLAGMFVLTSGTIAALLGPAWHGTASILALDSVVWATSYLAQGVPQFLRAVGRPDLVVLIRGPILLMQLSVFTLLAGSGMTALLWGKIAMEVVMLAYTGVILHRVFRLSIVKLLQGHLPLLGMTPAFVALSFFIAREALPHQLLGKLLLEAFIFCILSMLASARDPDSYLGHFARILRRAPES